VGNTTERIAEELRSKNAMEQIPLLEFSDPHTGERLSLTQSLAIIEYLEDAFPASHRVMPTCPLRRARARQVQSNQFLSRLTDIYSTYYLWYMVDR
jgi:glutathione S-transferase